MGKKRPRISVVIPALNEEKYLPRCLESFKKQTFADFEIIVSDGGSTDKTIAIAKRFGAITVVSKNTTVTAARQRGIEKSCGDIIVGADADTKYPPSHLAHILHMYTTHPDMIALGGGGTFEKTPAWAYWGWKWAYAIIAFVFRLSGMVWYVPAFNFSFKRDVFFAIGGYNTYLDFGGDELDILARLKKAGPVYFDATLAAYPSSRRANLGFFQVVIKHTLIDYYLNYALAKLFRKPILHGKPVR